MKNSLQVSTCAFLAIFVAAFGLFFSSQSVQGGGPISVSRTVIYGSPYQAYLDCSCMDGSYTVHFYNIDTVPISVSGSDWQIGPIPPQGETTYTLNDPGEYNFSIVEAPSQTGIITILNQAPSFPSGGKIMALFTGYNDVKLKWPELD